MRRFVMRNGVLVAGAMVCAVLCGFVIADDSRLVVVVFALVIAGLVAFRRPEILFAVGVLTTFIHLNSPIGGFVPTLPVGLGLSAAGVVVIAGKGVNRGARSWIAMGVIPLSLLAVRISGGSDSGVLLAIGACVLFFSGGVIVSARYPERAFVALAFGALVFAVISFVFGLGVVSPSGRTVGLSGSPNLLVFAVLSTGPFVLLSPLRPKVRFLTSCAWIVSAIPLVVGSGSAQALFMAGVLAATTWYVQAARAGHGEAGAAKRLATIVLGVGLLLPVGNHLLTRLGPKLSVAQEDYSGRSELFEASWSTFQASPVAGSGRLRVEDHAGNERSSHNAYLAILAGGGLFVGLPMMYLALRLMYLHRNRASRLSPTCPALAVVATGALAQGIEVNSWAWCVLGLAAGYSVSTANRDLLTDGSAPQKRLGRVGRGVQTVELPDRAGRTHLR